VPGWIVKSYVWPEELSRIWDHLEDMRGGVVGVVGLQGVGKRCVLRALIPQLTLLYDLYTLDLNSTTKILISLDSHATSYSMRTSPIRIR
jgi:hypothetical protein